MRKVLMLMLGAALATGCMFGEGDLAESVDEGFPSYVEEAPLKPGTATEEEAAPVLLNAHRYPQLLEDESGESVGELPIAPGPEPGKDSGPALGGPQGPSGLNIGPEGPGSLVTGIACDEVEDVVRARIIEAMEDAVDKQKENFMMYYCGWYWYDDDCDGMTNMGGEGTAPPPPPETSDSASEYSETNTQVAGVDEAYFI